MRKDVAGRGPQQRGGRFGVDERGQHMGRGGAGGEGGQNIGLPGLAMCDEPGQTVMGGINRGSVARIEHPPALFIQPCAGGHEIGQIAIRWRHKRAGPAHNVICGETRVFPAKTDVIADMSGGVDHVQRPCIALDLVLVSHDPVRAKIDVDAFAAANLCALGQLRHDGRAPGGRIAKGNNRRAAGLGQIARQGGMVQMGMGDDDMADVLAWLDGGQNRRQMARRRGARVDHSQTARADKIGVCPAIGHRRGVIRHNPAQTGFQTLGNAYGWVKFVGGEHGLAFRGGRGLAKVYNMFFVWLKRYMPRGIYGRAALILLLPVVILQLVVTVIFAQRNYEGVTTQMTITVLREVALVLNVAADAPSADQIAPMVRQRLSPLMMQVEPVMPEEQVQQNQLSWYDYSGRVMIGLFQERLAEFRTLDLTDPGRVHLFADTDHGPIQISFDRGRISASNPHQLFVYTFSFGFLMTLIAFLYLRNQLRPIKRLARAAEAFGRGRHIPYTPAGAVELRAAGSAFLDMRARIERHIEQRTLMLSGVSHDLRTPLTRMRLSLSMMEDPEAGPLLQDVEDMQRMLDEFLDFAKGAAEGEFEKLDPHALLKSAVAEAQRAGRNVTLLSPQGDGSGTVRLRKGAILRAVDNLISNAVRYGAKAEVSVLLTDKTLRIRVEDDGPGIPEDRRLDAVRPFSRLDPARNQNKGGGVGLGLAIATDIARAHGGVLRLGVSEDLGGLRADIVIAR